MEKHSKLSVKAVLVGITLFIAITVNCTFAQDGGDLGLLDIVMDTKLPEFEDASQIFLDSPTEDDKVIEEQKKIYFEALELLRENRLTEAKSRIDALSAYDAGKYLHYHLLAILNLLEKNPSSAEKNFTQSIELEKKNLQAYLLLAKLKFDSQDYKPAETYLNQAFAIGKSHSLNKSLLADCYLLMADIKARTQPDKVEMLLTEALRNVYGKADAEIKILNGFAAYYLKTNERAKILAAADEFLKRYPNNKSALSFLAKVQSKNGQTDSAIMNLRKIIELDKKDTFHRLYLAKILSKQANDPNDVLALIDDVIRLEPDNARALVIKSIFLSDINRHQDALNVVNELERKFPSFAFGDHLRGDIYFANRNYQKALDHYTKAYSKNKSWQLLKPLALSLNGLGKGDEAIALLEKEINTGNGKLSLKLILADLYQTNNRVEKAEKLYLSLSKEKPADPAILRRLALFFIGKQNKKAIDYAKRAYELSPDAPDIADTYGLVLLKNGLYQESVAILENALTKNPASTSIKQRLAEARIANTDKK